MLTHHQKRMNITEAERRQIMDEQVIVQYISILTEN